MKGTTQTFIIGFSILLIFCNDSASAYERKTLLMLIAEDEYETEITLPKFADQFLSNDFEIIVLL